VIRLVAAFSSRNVNTVRQIVPQPLRRAFRSLSLAGFLLCFAIQHAAAADDPRLASLREQISTLETMVAQTANSGEKAHLQEKLDRSRQELAVITERQDLESRAEALRESRTVSPLATLREKLHDVDSTVDAAAARVSALVALHQQAITEQDALEAEVEATRQRQGSEEEKAELKEKLYTKGEELRALALEREAAEDEAYLARDALALSDRIKADEASGSSISIRSLFRSYSGERAQRKTVSRLAAQAAELDQNAKVSKSALELAQLQLQKDDEELALLQRQTGFLNRDPQVERLIAEQRSQKNALGERLPFLVRQVEAVKHSQQVMKTRQELFNLEVAREDQQFQYIRAAWLRRLRWPAIALLALVVFQILTSRVLLPLFYRNETLFLARRLVRYLITALSVAVLIGFLFDDLSVVVTMLGVVSAALVISLQDVCTSVFGWFVIMAGGKLHIGDRLEVDGTRGDVIDIQLLRTTLVEINGWLGFDQPTGRVILVPNNFIFKHKVFNFTHGHPFIWQKIDVTVTFSTPIASALLLFQRVLEEETQDEFAHARQASALMQERYGVEDANYNPKIYTHIADSGVTLSLLFVTHYRRTSMTRNRINRRLVAELETHRHIQLAYNTIHIRNEQTHGSDAKVPSAILGPDLTTPPFQMQEPRSSRS
jgi:small-conductance mechanosensitive channel